MEMDSRRVPTDSFCKDGVEVDIAIARGARALAGVKIKAGAALSASAFEGPGNCGTAAGDRFAGGVVLYDGETSVGFGGQIQTVPIWLLWVRLR